MSLAPKPLGLPRAAVETVAEHFATETGYTPGASLLTLVHRLGGKIVYGTPRIPTTPTRLHADGPSDFSIHLPTMTSEAFNRMATATGLGFLVLHLAGRANGAPLIAPRWPEHDDAPGIEADREALQFAYALLLPRAAFLAAWRSAADSVKTAARAFGVSERNVLLRAYSLRLIPSPL